MERGVPRLERDGGHGAARSDGPRLRSREGHRPQIAEPHDDARMAAARPLEGVDLAQVADLPWAVGGAGE